MRGIVGVIIHKNICEYYKMSGKQYLLKRTDCRKNKDDDYDKNSLSEYKLRCDFKCSGLHPYPPIDTTCEKILANYIS